MKRFCNLAVLALALSAMLTAYPTGFGGAAPVGGSGVDPFGHAWEVKTSSWGIPGLGEGVLAFGGPDSALDFHATFWDDHGPIAILTTPASGPFGFEVTTRFSNLADGALWTRVIAGNHVDFFAGPSLENGENFFVNIVFARDIVGDLRFEAAWTGVPEPSSVGLMSLGVAGLIAAARRRMSR